MTYEIQQPEFESVVLIPIDGYVNIFQDDSIEQNSVYITLDNVDRFCAMMKQCAEEAKKLEA